MSNGVLHGGLTLYDCPRIRKSEYWQFIKLVAPRTQSQPPAGQTHWLSQDATDAFCLKCNKMFPFTKGSSNSVRRHMERFHPKELAKHVAAQQDAQQGSRKPGIQPNHRRTPVRKNNKRQFEPEFTVVAADPQQQPPQMNDVTPQPPYKTLAMTSGTSGAMAKLRSSSFGALEQRNGTELLARWLSLSLRPIAMVEDPGFAEFIEYISGHGGGFAIPSVETLRHRMELMVENVKFELRQRVKKESGHFALLLEQWQCLERPDAFLAVSCQYLNEEFELTKWTVSVLNDPNNPDTVGTMVEQAQEALRQAGLQKNLVTSVLTTTDDKHETLARSLGNRPIPDVVETLQQMVMDAIDGDDDDDDGAVSTEGESFSRSLSIVLRETLKSIREYCTSHPELGEKCIEKDSKIVCFPLIASIRALNSTMEAAALPTKPFPQEIVFVCECVAALLRPIHEIADLLSTEKVCSLPFLIPCLRLMKQQLSQPDLWNAITGQYAPVVSNPWMNAREAFRQRLLASFAERFDALCEEFAWSVALDPRHARLRYTSEQEREAIKAALVERAIQLYTSQALPPAASAQTTIDALQALGTDFDNEIMYSVPSAHVPRPTTTVPSQGLMHRLLYDDDEDVSSASTATAAAADVLSRDTELAQTRLYVSNEVAMYFSEHQLRKARIPCPLQWWRLNRERYPFLSPLARIWLCSAATVPQGVRHSISSSLVWPHAHKEREWRRHVRDRLFLHGNLAATSETSTISI